MPKKTSDDGKDIPPKLHRLKAKIERERFQHIKATFEQRCKPSADGAGSLHHLLAFIRSGEENNNGRGNNTLSSRIETPLHHFSRSSFRSNRKNTTVECVTLPSVVLPFVDQLPRSIFWAYTFSNRLMVERDSVIGKRQIYYVDGEAVRMGCDSEEGEEDEEEETEFKTKLKFSESVDQFIWKIAQERSLDDIVMQSALSKFLRLDASTILERYNELNKIKNGSNFGEASDKSIITLFQNSTDRRFCRRCLIFNCHTHDQHVLINRKTKSNLSDDEDARKQCSEHCYLKLRSFTEADHVVDSDNSMSSTKEKNVVSDTNTETEDLDTNQVTKDLTKMSIISHTCIEWTPLEKNLYLEGVEIFGKNSCLITRNLLPGLKTCLEVYSYMREQDQSVEDNETAETDIQVYKEGSRRKHRLARKKGLRKSARYPTALKNRASEENKPFNHYTPCTCEPICGVDCTCLTNGNCCEKYCKCLKTCNNRFGGCNCAKGQCANGQCPCFAAARECDPDLCRSCWFSCGDDESFGETSVTSQCKNMRFLIQQHKKILIAKSDIHGWGAFAGDDFKKHDLLGEYTGELISHEEADERGRPDELGSSYLFTLNDQIVIDARRKGNKLRFLNHSAKPNCYAKLMIVRGDHRIGIFANKAIEAGVELFFDYCYGPGQADWSRGSKSKESGDPETSEDISPSLDLDHNKQALLEL